MGMGFALSPTKNKMWIEGTRNQTGERCGRYESSPARLQMDMLHCSGDE